MTDYTPDRWVVVKITIPGEVIHKVIGSWYGGYTTGESWRMNSGITKVERDEAAMQYIFHGYSGSRYFCNYESYGVPTFTHGIVQSLIKQAEEQGDTVEVLDRYTEFDAL